MGKTLVYIVLLGILGFGVYYFLVRNNDALYREKEANFTFKDTSTIGKIFLVENNGTSVLLERGNTDTWVLNKQFFVMPVQILNLLTCLNKQAAFIPVDDIDHDRVIKMLAGMGTKVEVYDRAGKKMRSFTVAGQGPNYHGSYMILEKAETPYLVEVQGFEGYLTPIYNTDFNDWRSRRVFNLAPDSIKRITINYPSQPLNSFTIINEGAKPVVEVNEALRSSYTTAKPERINAYLNFFKNVNAEGYLNGAIGLDTIIKSARLRCNMQVAAKDGKTTDLDVYWVDQTQRGASLIDQTSTDPNHRPTQVERMYAVMHNTHDTMYIQALTFEKMFRQAFEFFQDDIPQQAKQQAMPSPIKKKKDGVVLIK